MERGDLMKVLICSDSHGRLDYFQQVMDLERPEIVIFAGDHSTDAIDMSLVYRDVLFAIVKGNTDMDDYESRETKIFDLMGKKVLLTHGHLYSVKTTLEELEKKAHLEKAENSVLGNTHKDFMAEKGGIIFLNTGKLLNIWYLIFVITVVFLAKKESKMPLSTNKKSINV